jgi:hypothetical protein
VRSKQFLSAIDGVPDERMSDRLEVHPDLMGSGASPRGSVLRPGNA